jgi:hypothetical protein
VEPSTTPTSSVTWTEIREVDSTELTEIEGAISFARQYAQRYTVRLVYSGKAAFDQAFAKLHQPLPGSAAQMAADEIEVALVSFLLMWRLFLDQTRHDLSQRFGDQSAEYNQFKTAASAAYDARPGYRFVEGLRNYVQHVGMPGLRSSSVRRHGEANDPAIVTDATVVMPRESLLEYLRQSGGQHQRRS